MQKHPTEAVPGYRDRLTEVREHNPTPARKLSRAALAFRAFHAAIALEMLLAIAYVWWCALSGAAGLIVVGLAVWDALAYGNMRSARQAT